MCIVPRYRVPPVIFQGTEHDRNLVKETLNEPEVLSRWVAKEHVDELP